MERIGPSPPESEYIMSHTEILAETPSFRAFLASGKVKLTESEYRELRNKCIDEMDEVKPDFSKLGVSGNMSWFAPRQYAFLTLAESHGIEVRWDSYFEDRLKKYLKEQGPNSGKGPLGKIEWYHQKREELEEIIRKEDEGK